MGNIRSRFSLGVCVLAASLALAAGVAAPARPAFNLNGTWSATFHCQGTGHGKLVVTNWNARSGTLTQKLTFARQTERGTATESGTTVTVNSSNLKAVIGRVGSVSK